MRGAAGRRASLMAAAGHTFKRRHLTTQLKPASWATVGDDGVSLCGVAVVDQVLLDDHHDTVGIPRANIEDLPMCKRCEGLAN